MRRLLEARDRCRGARDGGVRRRLWAAGEGGCSDCGSVANVHAVADCNTLADADADRDFHGDRNTLANANADRAPHVHADSIPDTNYHADCDTLPLVFAARTHGACLVVMGQS